jgi:apolipoprotein N-acyltransferase
MTLGRRLALAALGGAFLAASFPPLVLSVQTFLIFVAPALLLHALRGARPGEAALTGWIFGLSGVGVLSRWIVPALVASGHPLVAVAVLGGLALPATLFSLLHAFAEPRLPRRALVVLLPAFWIAIEWVKGRCPVVPMSWFALGDAFGASPSLCQAASIVGVHGLSLLVLVSALLFEAAIHEARAGHAGRAVVRVVAAAGLPTIVWELGFFVLVSAVPIEAALHMAFSTIIVQSTESVETMAALSRVGMRRAALDLTPQVDSIVWPEGAWPDSRPDPFEGGSLAAPLKAVAALAQSTFIFGCHREKDGKRYAAVVAVDRKGDLLAEYHKRMPDPYLEAPVAKGDGPVVFQAGRYRVGLAMGTDGTHPEVLRELAAAGAEVLVIPTGDPPEWPLAARMQHALQVPIRACELRCPIVRDSKVGITFAVDELGRPYRELHTEKEAILLSRLSGPGKPSAYVRWGYRLPQVATWVALGGVVLLVVRRRRSRGG